MCYQRPNHNSNTNNHGNDKPTHIPHSPFGHKWTEPYFDLQMPRNVTSLVGKSAYLGCRVRNLGNKTVAWIRHRDLHILTVGTYTYTTDQRFQTSFHRDIDEWTLQIKWAQKRDAGAYECQISTQPVRAFSVNLNIVDSIIIDTDNLLQQYYSDDAFHISSDRFYERSDDEFAGLFPMRTIAVPTATILGGPDLYVDKGSTINLTCAIKFSPEPPTHIFWYHQDKVLSEDSERGGISFVTSKEDFSKSILLIDNADLPDSGKYSCYPSNTEIASIRVHVLNGERPEAMQTSGATRITTLIGYNPSFLKLTTPVSTATISTILSTIYSTTTIIQILIAVILLKVLGNFLQYLNNWDIINALYNCRELIINDNIINDNSPGNNYIITDDNDEQKLGYENHNIIGINNKNFKKLNNKKLKNSYLKNYYYPQQQYQHPFKQQQQEQRHFQHYCQYADKNNYYQHCNNHYNNQYHTLNRYIREQILILQLYNENNYNICYYCSGNHCYCNYNCISNSINFNASNMQTHCNFQQQQKQYKNELYNNGDNVNDFRKISTTTITTTTITTNFNQLRMTNYLLKSSSLPSLASSSAVATSYRHLLNIINYENGDNTVDDDENVNSDEMNCHYYCRCICCHLFHSLKNKKKNSGEYLKQMSLQYLER